MVAQSLRLNLKALLAFCIGIDRVFRRTLPGTDDGDPPPEGDGEGGGAVLKEHHLGRMVPRLVISKHPQSVSWEMRQYSKDML
jgi:hypothetical protein